MQTHKHIIKHKILSLQNKKACSSSCSQTVSLSLGILSQFILRVCAAAEDRKNQ